MKKAQGIADKLHVLLVGACMGRRKEGEILSHRRSANKKVKLLEFVCQ